MDDGWWVVGGGGWWGSKASRPNQQQQRPVRASAEIANAMVPGPNPTRPTCTGDQRSDRCGRAGERAVGLVFGMNGVETTQAGPRGVFVAFDRTTVHRTKLARPGVPPDAPTKRLGVVQGEPSLMSEDGKGNIRPQSVFPNIFFFFLYLASRSWSCGRWRSVISGSDSINSLWLRSVAGERRIGRASEPTGVLLTGGSNAAGDGSECGQNEAHRSIWSAVVGKCSRVGFLTR